MIHMFDYNKYNTQYVYYNTNNTQHVYYNTKQYVYYTVCPYRKVKNYHPYSALNFLLRTL